MSVQKFFDQFGTVVRVGRHYAVGKSRASGTICIVFEDTESGELMLRRKKGDPCVQRLYGEDENYALAPDTKFTLVDSNGAEVTDPGYDYDGDQEYVKRKLAMARWHKDQLQAIAEEMIGELDAGNDSDLRDAIHSAVHGDMPVESIFHLMGA